MISDNAVFLNVWHVISNIFGIQDCQGSVRIDVAPQIRDFPNFGNELIAKMLTVLVIIMIVVIVIKIVIIIIIVVFICLFSESKFTPLPTLSPCHQN